MHTDQYLTVFFCLRFNSLTQEERRIDRHTDFISLENQVLCRGLGGPVGLQGAVAVPGRSAFIKALCAPDTQALSGLGRVNQLSCEGLPRQPWSRGKSWDSRKHHTLLFLGSPLFRSSWGPKNPDAQGTRLLYPFLKAGPRTWTNQGMD